MGLGIQNLLDTLSLSFVHCKNRVGLTTCHTALTFGLSLGSDLNLLLLDVLSDNLACFQALFLLTGEGALDSSLGLRRGNVSPLLGTGFSLFEVGVCIGYLSLSDVLTGDCQSLLVLDVDSLVCLGCLTSLSCLGNILGDLDLTGLVGLCSADSTVALGVGDIHTGVLDCSCCGLLTDALDVIRVVSDVDYVHVNQAKSDLLKLLSNIVVYEI